MSSIVISFKSEYRNLIEKNYILLNNRISSFTANLFDKNREEIVIDFEEFGFYKGSRDLLIKAETSRKNVDLLKIWSDGIKKIFLNSKLKDLNIGIKTFVIDSYWQEFGVK